MGVAAAGWLPWLRGDDTADDGGRRRRRPRRRPGGAEDGPSRVVSVTVYQNNALVTREVDVPAGDGTFELVVTPLPPQTVDSSLYSEGTDGIRVLTTRYRTRPIKEDTREEVRKVEAELKSLQQESAEDSRATCRWSSRTSSC